MDLTTFGSSDVPVSRLSMRKLALNCNDNSTSSNPPKHTHPQTHIVTHMKYIQHTNAHTHTHNIYTSTRPCLASQPPWVTSVSHLPCNCKIMPLKIYDISPSLVVANFSSKASRHSSAQSRSSYKSSFLPHSARGSPLWGVSRGCSLGAGIEQNHGISG